MSLLDDLRALDVGQIVTARASIRASVSTPGMSALVGAGAASSALGDLGRGLDGIRTSFPDASALLRPLVQVFEQLGGRFDTRGVPVTEYAAAVREGMQFLVGLVSSVAGNPSDFGQIFGTPLAQAVRIAGDRSGELTSIFALRADSFADLGRLAEQRTRDTAAITNLAADLLLPLPRTTLGSLRESLALVQSATGRLRLPTDRTIGLIAALDAVAVAAASADRPALEAALRELRQVRAHTAGILRDDLLFAIQQLVGLRVGQILQPFAELGRTLRLGQQGVIEFLEDFRAQLGAVRAQMESPDLDAARQFIQRLAPLIEERARLVIEVPIDAAVERAAAFVRRTLRQLPVRDLRDQLTRFLKTLVKAIDEADLDGPASAARGALAGIAGQLDAGVLTGRVREELQRVNQTITGALDGVIGALDTVQARVDELAGQAEAILDRLTDGLEAFRTALDAVAAAIDGLGIERVEQQLVQALSTLRTTASELIANVPLPEPLRPQVEQLIALLEGVDFDEVFDPVRRAVAELRIPPDVADAVEGGLAEARRVIDNLIPAQLIASIQAEVDAALATVRNFNPASLLPDVTQYLEQAARLVESLDPRAIAEQVRAPFQAVLDAVDRVHPNRLLAPVIEAYDALVAQIPVPEGETTARGLRGAFDSAGRIAGRAVLEPARRAAGGPESEIVDPETREPTPELPPPATDVHAGDAIRLLGFIPAKLRAVLSALEAGPAGEVLGQLDALGGGLARQIRLVAAQLHEAMRRLDQDLEDMLVVLGPSQLRAQLAIQTGFGADVSVQASVEMVAQAGPGGLRRELADTIDAMRRTAREVAAGAGGTLGASLERIAVALESSPLARLGADLDGLLAALDPEPIAAEMDLLVARMIEITPQLVAGLLPDLRALVARMRALINHYNPGAQAQKFLKVLEVVREELDVLDPRRLAAELAELHAAIRATITAYDPRALAEELAAVTRAMAQQIRDLDPQQLLGDVTFLQTAVDRVASANPAARLATVGQSLAAVGERLAAIDLDALVEAVNQLGPRLVESFEALIEAVRNEIVALLESLRFAVASGSVSVSASASVG
jgi:hypothetical protein